MPAENVLCRCEAFTNLHPDGNGVLRQPPQGWRLLPGAFASV